MSSTRMIIVLGVVGLTALLALPVLAAPEETDSDTNRMLAEVREATSQYQDLAAAEDDGYVLDDHCVPGMGHHALKEDLLPPKNGQFQADDVVDHTDPEVLVYAPRGEEGNFELVAVEYLSSDESTSLFGEPFDDPHPPVPASLHAWVWQGNPEGVFNPTNPKVSCPE